MRLPSVRMEGATMRMMGMGMRLRGAGVAVLVGMAVRTVGRMEMSRPSVPSEKEGEPEGGDRQAGDHRKPGIELLRHHVARGIERHHAEEIDPCRMRASDDQAQD